MVAIYFFCANSDHLFIFSELALTAVKMPLRRFDKIRNFFSLVDWTMDVIVSNLLELHETNAILYCKGIIKLRTHFIPLYEKIGTCGGLSMSSNWT